MNPCKKVTLYRTHTLTNHYHQSMEPTEIEEDTTHTNKLTHFFYIENGRFIDNLTSEQ